MRGVETAGLGIRAKLNLGVGIVVLVSALAFGSLYAMVERATILGEKHDHLIHVASMARLSFEGTDEAELREEIVEFNRHLSEATGAAHHMRIQDSSGQMLVGSDAGSNVAPASAKDTGLWKSLFPSSMTGEIPIYMGPGAPAARLIVEESLEDLPDNIRASFLSHVAFAAVLFGLTAFCTSLLAHFLIVRPVRELAAATERIGISGVWEPFSPSVRRRDEVGVLCDRFAELSRRLLSDVRDERYGSAHLVAVGMERGLGELVHHAEIELALLNASLPPGSEEVQRCTNLADHLKEIVALSHRVRDIGNHPPSSGA